MTGIWKSLMAIWCAATIALGLALTGAASPATDAGARFYYGLVTGLGEADGLFEGAGYRFSVALLGAVTLGWGVTILGVLAAGNAVAWRWLTLAVIVWYAVDGAISLALGFPLNAAANTVFLVAYLVPMLGSGVMGASSPSPRWVEGRGEGRAG